MLPLDSVSKASPQIRDLALLSPRYALRFVRYLKHLLVTFPQFDVIVTETLRTQERQDHLRQTGASRAVRSNHQDGIAMDIALFRKRTGEFNWAETTFANVYRVADPRNFELVSGGHLWRWDYVHLQIVEVQGKGTDLS